MVVAGTPSIKGITNLIKAPLGSTFQTAQQDGGATFAQKLATLESDGLYEKFVTRVYDFMTTRVETLPAIGKGLQFLHEVSFKLGAMIVLPAQAILQPIGTAIQPGGGLAWMFPESFDAKSVVIEAEGIYFLVPVIMGAVLSLLLALAFNVGLPATIKGSGVIASIVRAVLRALNSITRMIRGSS